MPKSPSPSELDAQIRDLQLQRDNASLVGAKAVLAALNNGKAGTLDVDLEALLPGVSTETNIGQVTNNVIGIIRTARRLLEGEIARIEAQVAFRNNPPPQP